jgi:hypothetical protein
VVIPEVPADKINPEVELVLPMLTNELAVEVVDVAMFTVCVPAVRVAFPIATVFELVD